MSEDQNINTTAPTYAVNITAQHNDVNVSFSKEVSVWQAIGLLETALIFLKEEYAKSSTTQGS